jgi:putative acetyltransferase
LDLVIAEDDPRADDVRALLERHLAFSRAVTPPGHVHALDVDGLLDPAVSFLSARFEGVLLGVGALKQLDLSHGELKSMHTAEAARGQGVGRAMVDHLLAIARARCYRRVSLETGTMDAYAPARALYAKVGFVACEPFGDYTVNPHSTCMTIDLVPWVVRPVLQGDLPAVQAILERWLIDPGSGRVMNEEIEQRVATLQAAIDGHPSRRFFVAVDQGEAVLGVAGLQGDGIDADLFSAGERPIEVVAAYVHPAVKGNGLGRALLQVLENAARGDGFTTLLVVSGSRNREDGYPFWRRRYGEPVHVDADHFGPGQERVVWRMPL